MVCGGPMEPKPQGGRQRPKPSWVMGLGICSFGDCTHLGPGPETPMRPESCETVRVQGGHCSADRAQGTVHLGLDAAPLRGCDTSL